MTLRLLGLLVAKRLVVAVGLLLLVSFGVFSLLYIAPGSVEQILVGARPTTPALLAELRQQYHLDDPFLAQYWGYLSNVLQFDFGESIRTSQPVLEAVSDAIPVSVFLGLYAFVLTMAIGVVLGMVAAIRKRSALDRAIVGFSVFGVSAPAFATGILLIYVFSVQLPWFPSLGAGSGFGDRLQHLTLPALALAVSASALVVKLTRAAMINALEQDFMTFARARGLNQRRVLLAYALRNALVPIVSAGGLILGYVLTGAVLVEVTFSLPGLGNLLIQGVESKDVPVVQAVAMLFSAVIILINLAMDVAFLLIDPRIRLERQSA